MEADLLTIYGADLPEDWRQFVSLRRLLVIVRNLGPSSAVARATNGWWTTEMDLLDDIRRVGFVRAGSSDDMHPLRPLGRLIREQQEAKRRRSEQKRKESIAREAARQERLKGDDL